MTSARIQTHVGIDNDMKQLLEGMSSDIAAAVVEGGSAAIDTDATMTADSDTVVPSQKAVKTALATKQATITKAAFCDPATTDAEAIATALIAAGLMDAS